MRSTSGGVNLVGLHREAKSEIFAFFRVPEKAMASITLAKEEMAILEVDEEFLKYTSQV